VGRLARWTSADLAPETESRHPDDDRKSTFQSRLYATPWIDRAEWSAGREVVVKWRAMEPKPCYTHLVRY
jgi:hypothetical protein